MGVWFEEAKTEATRVRKLQKLITSQNLRGGALTTSFASYFDYNPKIGGAKAQAKPSLPNLDQIARNTKMFLFERLGVQLGSVGIFKSPKFRGLRISKRVSFSQVSSVMQSNNALQTLEIKMDMRALSAFLKKENFLRLTNDAVFKNFLTKNEELLKSLLQSFLPLPKNSSIENVVVLNSELTPQRLASDVGKTYILDLIWMTARQEENSVFF